MPFKCSVPNCKGNSRGGPKVSVFKFPKSEFLRNKWIAAIPKDNFKLTDSSRVCRLHFKDDDVEKETSFLCSDSGRLVTAPLLYPRLKSEAVPSQFFEHRNSFPKLDGNTKKKFKRKKLRNETQKAKEEVISKNFESDVQHEIEQQFFTLDELNTKISSLNLECWEILRKETCTYLFYFIDVVHPCAKCFLKITKDLQVTLFYQNTSISSLPNSKITFPLTINTLNKLENLLNDVKSLIDSDFDSISINEKIGLINDLFVSLASQSLNKEVIFAIQGKWLMEVS